jgi:hypothetical protein
LPPPLLLLLLLLLLLQPPQPPAAAVLPWILLAGWFSTSCSLQGPAAAAAV